DFDFFAGQTQWIADITYNTAALAKDFGNWGHVGVSALFADYGEIEGTIVADNEDGYEDTEDVDVGAYAIGLAYAYDLTDRFSVGGHARYVSQQLGESILEIGAEATKNEVSGLSFDFGTMYYPGYKSFRFGMNVRNFSKEFKYENEGFQLPLTFTMGVAMDIMDFTEKEDHSVLVAFDAIHPRDYSERINFGCEYWFKKTIALRFGYKYNYDEEGLTAGTGFNYDLASIKLKLDYAYADCGIFDAVHRFSLGFAF
ncbi:MAG: PorV/PorQ family protein, partial [Planctomycetes bacterium]|nr:PorV/PorQ family protein [Planctomycetota bacterium]